MSNRCLMCGRVLKSKNSIKLGYGSVCYKKLEEKRSKKNENKDEKRK